MKHKKERTLDEVLSASEGEWVFMPEGVRVESRFDQVEATPDRIVVSLPARAIRTFRPGASETFDARLDRGTLIVERRTRKRTAAKPRAKSRS